MKPKLDSVLLFALVIPFIMTYRISPGTTPYWLFGLIFLGLILYFLLDLSKLKENLIFNLKFGIFWFLIIATIGSAFFSEIVVRHQTVPTYNIHDIIIQQESAIRFFLDGKNPYSTSYFGTPLEKWRYSDIETNPALYHFVMQPFYLIFALPFYFFTMPLFGFFDGRMPLLFLFFTLLATASFVVKDKERKLLFLILLAYNPAILGYTLEGRSDIFMFPFLFLGFFLLEFKNLLSGIMIALAFTVKQSAWPLFPFYLAFLYFKTRSFKKTVKLLVPFVLTFLIITLPFFFWDKKAFIDSTVFYLSGSGSNSYPISGYGFGMLMHELGSITDLKGYYPFTIWQIGLSIPLVILFFKLLRQKTTVQRLIFIYGIFLFIFWYFSRYFNNSHLAYLSMVFIVAYFWPDKEQVS